MTCPPKTAWAALAALVLGAPLASAQQFKNVPNIIPGPGVWTEGVEPADVDNDGDLDLFFADGDGFSGAGPQRQNKLIINLLESNPGVFTDESVARLGVNLSNGKMVITGDIQNDGWIDALFANAFNTDTPFLYVNQGVGNPGFYNMESAARGLTNTLSSAGAQFGDLDNDGDLDLIISHSGANFFGGSGGRPQLYFNDGSGNFTLNQTALGASLKRAHMDVQFADVDNDWDLDFIGPNRATNSGGNHYLMLNDGGGNFTDASSLIPNGSTLVYEIDVSDLDGDDDLDLYFISLNSFDEGPAGNDLVPGGSLDFNAGGDTGGDDDNEIAFLDYDNDGDLDPFVGSLGAREKIMRNDGGLGFVTVGSQITNIADSTLDIAIADMNNDGSYDLISAQGESVPSQYINKIYRNTGGADTTAPRIVREESLVDPDAAGPWVVRAQIRDEVMDDGKNWVTAEVEYVVNTAAQTATVHVGQDGFSLPVLEVQAGTTVSWINDETEGLALTVRALDDAFEASFRSPDLARGDRFERTFVRPGTYLVSGAASGEVAQIVVGGTTTTIPATYSGGGIYRFAMTDTQGGAGVELCYQLRFTDWAGNVEVSTAVDENLIDCGPVQYDVGISSGNTIVLDSVDEGAVGGLLNLAASNVSQDGFFNIYLIGFAATQIPAFDGMLLVDLGGPWFFRLRAISGSGTSNYALLVPDDNTLIGASMFVQTTAVDNSQPQGWAFSNGLEVVFCP